MQRSEAFHEAHAGAAEHDQSDLLDALLISAPNLLDRYQEHLLAIRRTLQLELKLNLKCAALIMLLALVLSCVILSSWLGLNYLVFLGLTELAAPIWAIATTILSLHLAALALIVRSIKLLFSEMGFVHAMNALGISSDLAEEYDS